MDILGWLSCKQNIAVGFWEAWNSMRLECCDHDLFTSHILIESIPPSKLVMFGSFKNSVLWLESLLFRAVLLAVLLSFQSVKLVERWNYQNCQMVSNCSACSMSLCQQQWWFILWETIKQFKIQMKKKHAKKVNCFCFFCCPECLLQT